MLMTQADRDRLVTLRKAKEAPDHSSGRRAEELGLSVRQVKRLFVRVEEAGRQGRDSRAAR